jgi:hypothetical protein
MWSNSLQHYEPFNFYIHHHKKKTHQNAGSVKRTTDSPYPFRTTNSERVKTILKIQRKMYGVIRAEQTQ